MARSGTRDLAEAMEGYAQSRADLAVAYDEELTQGMNDAFDAFGAAADRITATSSDAGAFECAVVVES